MRNWFFISRNQREDDGVRSHMPTHAHHVYRLNLHSTIGNSLKTCPRIPDITNHEENLYPKHLNYIRPSANTDV